MLSVGRNPQCELSQFELIYTYILEILVAVLLGYFICLFAHTCNLV